CLSLRMPLSANRFPLRRDMRAAGSRSACPNHIYSASRGFTQPAAAGLPSGPCRSVKGALDLDDIVLVQPGDLDDGARRIRPRPPKLLLDQVHQWPIAGHVG